MSDPVRTIAERVRTRVLRDGVDLAGNDAVAARYAREEVRRYSERALGGCACGARRRARHRTRRRRVAHRVRAAAAVLRRPRRSRRSGSTRPTRVFIAQGRCLRAHDGHALRPRGARARRADAAALGPPRRPVVAVRRRVAARRLAAARRDPRCHAGALGGQHPQVPAAHPHARPRSSSSARSPRPRPSSCA